MGRGKVKVWVLNNEKEIEPDTYVKKNQIPDKHIELERTASFMRFVWMIGGLVCIGMMRATEDWSGLIVGLIGIGAIWLISKAVTTKLFKDIHLLFYAERDFKHDDYYAIDIKTNEILYVQHIFADPNDENPSTLYAFESVAFDDFKSYVRNCSERLYKKIEKITYENRKDLCNIQFGETNSSWINFLKKEENEIYQIGCLSIRKDGKVAAKYVELTKEIFENTIGRNDNIYGQYEMFIKTDFSSSRYESLCYVDRILDKEEKDEFVSIYNGNTSTCSEKIETLFIKDFINENEYSGNATTADIEGIKFLKKLTSVGSEWSFGFVADKA